MLMRRFTIVCLLTALFAMALALLVAETGREADGFYAGTALSCRTGGAGACRPAGRN